VDATLISNPAAFDFSKYLTSFSWCDETEPVKQFAIPPNKLQIITLVNATV
jgi:hypothetical protein